ncbi:MAG: MFS transporter [Pseudomonadota bacterium]
MTIDMPDLENPVLVSAGRKTEISLLLAYFSWGIFWGGWGVLIPQFKYDLGFSESALGFALMGISIGAMTAMMLGGKLVRNRPELALTVLLFAFACASVLLGEASGFVSLAICLVVLGMMSGLLDIALNINVFNTERSTGRALFQRAHGVFPLGVILASPMVGLARDAEIPTQAILWIIAAFMIPPLLLFYSGTRRRAGPQATQTAGSDDANNWTEIFARRTVAGVGGICALIVIFLFLENAVEQWSTLFVEQSHATRAATASLTPSLYMAAIFVGRMAAHRWAHIITIDRALRWGAIGTAAGFVLMAFSQSIYVTLFLATIMGLFVAPIVPGLYSWISTHVGEDRRAAVLGLVTTLSYLGYLLSPVFVGGVASTALGLDAAWVALGLVAVGAYVLIKIGPSLSSPEPKGSDQ